MTPPSLFTAERRRPFTVSQKLEILRNQAEGNGEVKCGCGCGEVIAQMTRSDDWIAYHTIEYDHVRPLSQGGAHEVENAAALRKKCHSRKSRADWGATSKAKRQGGETGQQAKRRLLGSRMQSRGFRNG